MTIYKLWRNTADDFKRALFGEHFFTDLDKARSARERALQNDIGHFKAKGIPRRNIQIETRDGGTDLRVVAVKRYSGGMTEDLAACWLRIDAIKTED